MQQSGKGRKNYGMRLLRCLIAALAICLVAMPAFTTPVQANPGGIITLSPTEGCVGDKLTVNGEGFRSDNTVRIYYDDALQAKADVAWGTRCPHGFFTVSFTIPEGCQGYHDVYAEGTTSGTSVTARFKVNPGITLDRKLGHAGDNVTVTGGGFSCSGNGINIRYYLDDDSYIDFPVTTEADKDGSWEESFPAPASAEGAHTIDAYYNNDTHTLSQVREASFEMQPEITLNPDVGCAGDIIAVSGAGFEAVDDIGLRYDHQKFGDYHADEYGSWGEVSFTIPPGARGSHVIEAFHSRSTTAIASAMFTLEAGIKLQPATSVSSPGHVGQTFSVTGKSFDSNVAVNITYQNKTTTVFADAEGNLPAVTFIAQGKHGEQYINASYEGNSTRSAVFYMEGTLPDEPTLDSPIDSRTGFFGSFTGRICPTFKWSNVTDPSGIASYDLQIYHGDNSTISIPVPIESVSFQGDIVAYSLSEKYALAYGSYYWKVRAIDGAENEGNWTEAKSFRAGFLPQWAMITIAVGLLLVVILVGMFIMRRRGYYDYWD
jgi:hypothetical protein